MSEYKIFVCINSLYDCLKKFSYLTIKYIHNTHYTYIKI